MGETKIDSDRKALLVVEDDVMLLSVYSQMKIKDNKELKILIANDGKEAIDYINKYEPDIILLDLVMPNVDGFDVLEHMNKTGQIKKSKVYVLTNLSDEQTRKRVMDLGAADYMIKSNTSIKLIKKLIEEA